MTGFYKKENDNLLHGANFVLNANYHLTKETKDDHTYPIDGWYWFDTEEEAREFLGIPVEEEPELDEFGNPIPPIE